MKTFKKRTPKPPAQITVERLDDPDHYRAQVVLQDREDWAFLYGFLARCRPKEAVALRDKWAPQISDDIIKWVDDLFGTKSGQDQFFWWLEQERFVHPVARRRAQLYLKRAFPHLFGNMVIPPEPQPPAPPPRKPPTPEEIKAHRDLVAASPRRGR